MSGQHPQAPDLSWKYPGRRSHHHDERPILYAKGAYIGPIGPTGLLADFCWNNQEHNWKSCPYPANVHRQQAVGVAGASGPVASKSDLIPDDDSSSTQSEQVQQPHSVHCGDLTRQEAWCTLLGMLFRNMSRPTNARPSLRVHS